MSKCHIVGNHLLWFNHYSMTRISPQVKIPQTAADDTLCDTFLDVLRDMNINISCELSAADDSHEI